MANDFDNGVWILDTANTSIPIMGVTSDVRVSKLEWQPSAADQTLTLKDGAGDTKFSRTSVAAAPSGTESEDYIPPLVFHEGFVLHTLTSGGKVYVYLA